MFPRIQNETLKKECIWVRIRGDVLAKKGAPKLNFYCEEGGCCLHLPPKSTTASYRVLVGFWKGFGRVFGTVFGRVQIASV